MKNDEMIKRLEATGDYRVIRRFEPVDYYNNDDDQEKMIGIYLDTETTGIDFNTDKIIELAMVPFEFHSSGKIYRLLPAYNSLQDPGIPITEEVTRITGITDEMVKGQAIDIAQVSAMLSSAVIVIAHNAGFDRPFVEKLCDNFRDISWGCSFADVNWSEEGIESAKLEYLAYKFGFFFEGHRATIDCLAGIHILSQRLPLSGEQVLKSLLDSARRTDFRLWAANAPFEKKDDLKKRGYRWSAGEGGKPKAWYKDLPEELMEAELDYLGDNIYMHAIKDLPRDRINAKIRYSDRV